MRPVLSIASALLLVLGSAGPVAAGPYCCDDDNDTVPAAIDNCVTVPNGPAQWLNNQCDTDSDGYGNACDADPNNDGVVGIPDYTTFLAAWNGTSPESDYNCDSVIGIPDYTTFLNYWNGAPGPSGLSCAGTIPCP